MHFWREAARKVRNDKSPCVSSTESSLSTARNEFRDFTLNFENVAEEDKYMKDGVSTTSSPLAEFACTTDRVPRSVEFLGFGTTCYEIDAILLRKLRSEGKSHRSLTVSWLDGKLCKPISRESISQNISSSWLSSSG